MSGATSEGYRDELAAAQQRIAQLEEEVAELRRSPDLELARLATERALLEAELAQSPGLKRGWLVLMIGAVSLAAAITAATLGIGGRVNPAAFFVLPSLAFLAAGQYRTQKRRLDATREVARLRALEGLLRTRVAGVSSATERVRIATRAALVSEPLVDDDDESAPREARAVPPR